MTHLTRNRRVVRHTRITHLCTRMAAHHGDARQEINHQKNKSEIINAANSIMALACDDNKAGGAHRVE